MLVVGCKQPGIRSTKGSLNRAAWNCDLTGNFANEEEYPVANNCLEDEKHTFYVSFDQSTGRESLIFPPGTGIPVGGDSGIDFLTLQIHYLYYQSLPNGMTGHPTIRVRLHPVDPLHDQMKKAGTLSVYGFERMNPLSVGAFESPIPISDWTDNQTVVHPIAVHIHTHEAAISTTLWKIDGQQHRMILWSQDPQKEIHYHTFEPTLTLGPGDAFDLECIYYNNKTILQKIG